jgi:hypothetical protein
MDIRRLARRPLWAVLVLLMAAPSQAQTGYALDSPADDHDESTSVRYFGSAKDGGGRLLADVTVLLDTADTSLVFVTDGNGRFRGHLPLDIPMSAVTPTCAKAGYVLERVSKRSGPKSARASVQVDCVLRRAS